MCSIQYDEVEETVVQPQLNKSSCKCGSSEIVLNQKLYGAFCMECFLNRMSHKFRSEFGRSKVIRDDEEVVVAFSGGLKSCAMLNLILEGKSTRAQKKLRFRPHLVCIIDDSMVGRVDEKHKINNVVSFMVDKLVTTKLPFKLTSIGQMCQSDDVYLLTNDDVENHTDLVSMVMDRMKNLNRTGEESWSCDITTNQITGRLLLKELLGKVARKLGIRRVLMGSSMEGLAQRILSDVCQGRGDQLAFEVQFADERLSEVTFVKPLRTFLHEELQLLLQLKSITHLPPQHEMNPSIDTLSRDFLLKLQEENNNTLSIVCRTGDKLSTSSENSQATNSCLYCKSPITEIESHEDLNRGEEWSRCCYACKIVTSNMDLQKKHRLELLMNS